MDDQGRRLVNHVQEEDCVPSQGNDDQYLGTPLISEKRCRKPSSEESPFLDI